MSRYLLALFILLPSCLGAIDGLDPQVGDPLVARCSNTDSEPDKDISFRNDVQPILRGLVPNEPGCGCHLPSDPNPIGLEETGLDLSTYSGLLAGGSNSSGGVINPGAPCDSVIWKKISPGPSFGARMPFDGPPFLTQSTRQLISDWISEGARDN